jgi:hypothetical protein
MFLHFNGPAGPLGVQAVTGTSWTTWQSLGEVNEPTMWEAAVETYNQFFDQDAWAAEQVFQQRVQEGQERKPVSGDRYRGQLAIYLTSLKVIQTWPVYSNEYHQRFKKRLDGYRVQALM